MKRGDVVLILPSLELKRIKLDEIVGFCARILTVNGTFGNIRGCWVKLPIKFLGEDEWYIPYDSLGI